jgi:hypothetical protein
MDPTEMQHEPTGMSFSKWLDDPDGLPTNEPIGLIEIRDVFNSTFSRYRLEYGDWLDGVITLRCCVCATWCAPDVAQF